MQADTFSHTRTAEYYLYDWTPSLNLIDVKQMDEQNYRDSSWLDSRIRSSGIKPFRYPFSKIESFFGEPPAKTAPLIFHIGHCGSTLLSRVLSASPNILPLREPRPLRALSQCFSELDHPARLHNREQWDRVAKVLMHSYCRTFGEHQTAQIKMSSFCNNLISPLIENELFDRALLLYQSLYSHLASTLGIDMPSSDLRSTAAPRMWEWMKIPGAPTLQVSEMSLSELSVLNWLGSMYLLLGAQEQYPQHCKLHSFGSFLANPAGSVVDICEWFDMSSECETLLANLEEETSRNSKLPGKEFSARDRQEKHKKVHQKKQSEISHAMTWAAELCETVPALSPCAEYFSDQESQGS